MADFKHSQNFFLIIILLTVFVFNSCKDNTEIVSSNNGTNGNNSNTQSSQKSILSGQVISSLNGIPVDSAFVNILGTSIDTVVVTNSQGKFSAGI